MTKRIVDVAIGIIMILFALLLMMSPTEGFPVVTMIIGISIFVRGVGTMIYYFRMAKHMVGGKYVLYRGIFYLDLGLFILSLTNDQLVYMIFYIAIMTILSGVVDLLRARESKKLKAPQWIFSAVWGVVCVLFGIAVIVSMTVFHDTAAAVYVFAGSLIGGAVHRIAGALRRTEIVYVA